MAKKEKTEKVKNNFDNVALGNEELVPVTIGRLEHEKNAPGLLLVVFLILIFYIFGLPYVEQYIEEKSSGNTTSTTATNTNTTTTDDGDTGDDVEDNDVDYYELSSSLQISFDGVTMSNFVIDESTSTITYSIYNENANTSYFINNIYYIELYSSDKTLLQRIKMSSTTLTLGSTQSYIKNLDSSIIDSVYYIVVIDKTEDDYPAVTLTKESDSVYSLTCTGYNHEYYYEFDSSQQLTRITDTYEYTIDNSDYTTALVEARNSVTNYSTLTGVVSAITEASTGFSMVSVLTLKNIDLTLSSTTKILSSEAYYSYQTLAKVVDFEMSAQMYTCK